AKPYDCHLRENAVPDSKKKVLNNLKTFWRAEKLYRGPVVGCHVGLIQPRYCIRGVLEDVGGKLGDV
ncbi:MAG: hypothetical protein WB992_02630, partial [Bryobacteraceae bacterium]